jgi:hypothetical protein
VVVLETVRHQHSWSEEAFFKGIVSQEEDFERISDVKKTNLVDLLGKMRGYRNTGLVVKLYDPSMDTLTI